MILIYNYIHNHVFVFYMKTELILFLFLVLVKITPHSDEYGQFFLEFKIWKNGQEFINLFMQYRTGK